MGREDTVKLELLGWKLAVRAVVPRVCVWKLATVLKPWKWTRVGCMVDRKGKKQSPAAIETRDRRAEQNWLMYRN